VRDTAGLPVSGVRLSLTVRSRVDRSGSTESPQDVLAEKTGLSEADGEWSIEVPVGMPRLTVDTTVAGNRYLARFENEDEFDVTDFTQPVEIVVAPGCVVAGRVEGYWAGRAAAEDLNVYIVREQALKRPASQRTARLATDATFEFDHMGTGTYSAELKRSGIVVTEAFRFEIPADFEEGATIPVTLDFPE